MKGGESEKEVKEKETETKRKSGLWFEFALLLKLGMF